MKEKESKGKEVWKELEITTIKKNNQFEERKKKIKRMRKT